MTRPGDDKVEEAETFAQSRWTKCGCLVVLRLALILIFSLSIVCVIFELDCRQAERTRHLEARASHQSPALATLNEEVESRQTPNSSQPNDPLLPTNETTTTPPIKQQDSNQWLLFELSTSSSSRSSQDNSSDKRLPLLDPFEDEMSSGEESGDDEHFSNKNSNGGQSSPFAFEIDKERQQQQIENKSNTSIKSFKIHNSTASGFVERPGQKDKQETSKPKARRRRATKISNKPILNEFSFPANLVQGMRFVLMCQVLDGEPPIQIKWFKDTMELGTGGASNANSLQLVSVTGDQPQPQAVGNNNNKLDEQVELISSDELGSSLLFRKIKQQHGGNYTCSATNRFGSASYSSVMSVKVPPNWRLEPQDRESVMGEQITIDCQATGNPNPFIRWKFTSVQLHELQQQREQQHQQRSAENNIESNGNYLHANNFKLINSNHQVQTLENGSLSIRQTSKEHEGFYLCEADNGVEPSLMKAIRLIVHQQAHFLDEIQVLSSSSDSNNNNQLMMARQQQQQQQQSPTSSGVAAAPTVPASALGPPGAIKSIRLPQNTSLIRLVCNPFGDLPLQLDWLKDGHLIYSYSSTNGDGKQTLSTSPHAGDDNQSLPPIEQLNSSPPFDQISESSTSAASVSIGRYHVNSRRIGPAAGMVSPTTTKHYKQLAASNGLESELILASLIRHDAGVYTCLAKNAFGQSERKLRLVVQEQPEAPSMIDVAHVSSRSIGLRWLSPFDGNTPILKYIIEYKRQTMSEQQQQLSSGKLAVVDSDAPTSRSEKVMPALASASGGGATLNLKDSTLPPLAATTNSLGQRSSGLFTTSSLDEQLANNQLADPTGANKAQQQQQQTIQHTIHDLEPLTRYSIRIIAVNSLGQSRPSVALSLRTEEEVPSTVPNLVEATVLSSKSIKLQWTISYSLEHELIDGFFVGYRSFDTSALLVAESTSTTAPTTIIGGGGGDTPFAATQQQQPLSSSSQSQQQIATAKQSIERPTFTYKTIRLTNQQQQQQTRTTSAQDQQEQQAAAPNGRLQQQQQLNNDGLDSGAPLLSPISTITKTIPKSSLAGGGNNLAAPTSQQQQQHVLVVSNFEYIINGLERNTEYTILIQCFNKKGAGPTSDPVVFKTFSIDPPEKLNLIAEENSESSVRISWHFLNEQPAATSMLHSHLPTYGRFAATANSFEPIDGFVLTYAKISLQSKSLGNNLEVNTLIDRQQQQNKNQVQKPDSAARISHPILLPSINNNYQQSSSSNNNSTANQLLLLSSANSIKQWHATQLAPQQRTHLVKNLECGSWYAMRILAFNKVGKGEPSDLVTVGTRGKAPVAPDRRSFLSINSTQVRLHLSAWYDGGCEIEKFILQYRARNQQQEWILVSNNILREQNSILIKDLLPATAYETLVGAQNQVGLTEVKYRFVTLDLDGKQVSSGSSSSFLSGSPFTSGTGGGDDDDDEDNLAVDYSESGAAAGTRREVWSSSTSMSTLNGKWLLVIKQILNSPFTLLLAFCLFVILLIMLVINRFNSQGGPSGGSTTSTTTLNSSSGGKLNSGGGGGGCGDPSGGSIPTSLANQHNHNHNHNHHQHHHLQQASYLHHGHCGSDGVDCEPAMSLANDCSTTTPPLTESSPSHVNLAAVDRVAQQHQLQQHHQASNSSSGDYTSRMDCYAGSSYGCGVPMNQSAAATGTTTEMSYNSGEHYANSNSNQPNYYSQTNTGAHNAADSHYASVHRSATMDASTNLAVPSINGHHDHPDGQQCLMQMLLMAPQQQQQQQQHQQTPYTAAALSTSANRHKSGTMRLPATSANHQHQPSGYPSMTLGRQQIQHYQTFQAPGKL